MYDEIGHEKKIVMRKEINYKDALYVRGSRPSAGVLRGLQRRSVGVPPPENIF